MARLTRDETRAITRARLVDAATVVFAAKGFDGASVEEIADRAGYSRGAFYSNFSDKAELFLAVHDQHSAEQTREIVELFRLDPNSDAVFSGLQRRSAGRSSDARRWFLLRTEFWLYAIRNRTLRPKLAARVASERRAIARAVDAVLGHLGIEAPLPSEQLASIVMALEDGIAIQRSIDARALPESFFYDTLALLIDAARLLQRERDAPSSSRE